MSTKKTKEMSGMSKSRMTGYGQLRHMVRRAEFESENVQGKRLKKPLQFKYYLCDIVQVMNLLSSDFLIHEREKLWLL